MTSVCSVLFTLRGVIAALLALIHDGCMDGQLVFAKTANLNCMLNVSKMSVNDGSEPDRTKVFMQTL